MCREDCQTPAPCRSKSVLDPQRFAGASLDFPVRSLGGFARQRKGVRFITRYENPCECKAGESCCALKSRDFNANRDLDAEASDSENPNATQLPLAAVPCATRPLALDHSSGGEGSSTPSAKQ